MNRNIVRSMIEAEEKAVRQIAPRFKDQTEFEQFIASVEGMDSPKCPCHYCASEQTRPEGA